MANLHRHKDLPAVGRMEVMMLGRIKRAGREKLWLGSIAAAFAASIAVFLMMLQMEKSMLSHYEKGAVYVASKAIPKGQTITEENQEEYLESAMLDVNRIPEAALLDLSRIQELSAAYNIEEGVLLTRGMFLERDAITEGMREPVIAGFKAEDVCQVAGGILRAGDSIHIYHVDEEGRARLKWSDIFVRQVFDGSGRSIPGSDTQSLAQRVNIYLDKADVEAFYTELTSGSLRVVKVCD